uniref:Ribonuclease H-like domain-containing protein n=1 Tax=Tanacetum cinerariifolium TaxID=118510 RepID=A0A6L2J2Y7_TANCI|nr:ribonuclease H-like domain-containing protein [Tanacetum cinerariifolium]
MSPPLTPSPSTSNTMPPPPGSNTMQPPPTPSGSNTIPSHATPGSNTSTGSNTMSSHATSASIGTNKGEVVSAVKLPILNPNEFDLWKMRIEQYFLMTNYSLWEVILNGDSPAPTRVVEGILQPVAPITAEQKLARKNELKAHRTLLMALPDKHQLKFNSRSSSESLDQIHDKLQKLVSQLEIHGVSLSQEDVNLKFLQSLPYEWKTHTLIWRNKVDLEEQSLDDFFNISVDASVSAVCAKLPVSSLPNVDSLSNAVIYSFFASQSSSPQLDNEDLKQIDSDDHEEMDQKWKVAMLTMWDRRFLQRTGRNLGANGPTSLDFDMSKVECYNYHMKGHFARECRSPKDSRKSGATKPQKRTVPRKSLPIMLLWLSHLRALLLLIFVNPNLILSHIKQLRDNALVTLRKKLEKAEQERDDLKLKLSPTKPEQDFSHTNRPTAPIIEDWVSNFEVESETKAPQIVSSFVQSTKQVKSLRPSDQHAETSIPTTTPKPTSPKPASNGKRRNRKACFVCKILTQSKPVSITAVRPVSTVVRKIKVTRPKQVRPIVTKPKSPIRRYITRNPSPKTNNSPPRVSVVKAPVVSVAQGLQGKWEWRPKCPILDHVSRTTSASMTLKGLITMMHLGDPRVIDNGCSRYMTGNMSYLSNFEELNGGYVSFGDPNPIPKAQGELRKPVLYAKYASMNHSKFPLHKVSAAAPPTSQPVLTTSARPVSTVKPKFSKTRPNLASHAVSKSKSPLRRHFPRHSSSKPSTSPPRVTAAKPSTGNPQQALKDKGFIDSGCSRHMTGNMSYFSDFEELNGGYVAFGGNPKGGKITGKGKIKTGKLDFNDVYFVKELKFNLFSVSQTCDKKNSVLFTDTECLVLYSDFKLPNASQVLLRVPRENNMYNVNLKNIIPSGDLTCLFVKATLDESNLWHRRLGKFDGKVDEGFLVGYSVSSKVFRVFNSRTRIVQETLHANFLENKPSVAGSGPTWLFDIDNLTRTMNYQPVTIENQTNPSAGFQNKFNAEKTGKEINQQYVLFPVWSSGSTNPQNSDGDAAFNGKEPDFDAKKPESEVIVSPSRSAQSKKQDDKTKKEAKGKKLEDITYSDDEDDVGAEADFNNLETSITVSHIPTIRVHKDHPVTQIVGDLSSATQTRRFEDPDHPDKVYKVVKALYGLHQAPRAWSMIGSLMYLTSPRPDIMFAQTVVATSFIEAEYVAAASCCVQVLWIRINCWIMGVNTPRCDEDRLELMELTVFLLPKVEKVGIGVSVVDLQVSAVNDVTRLQALVDKKKVVDMKSTIREALRLDDEEGVECLPNEEFFTELARMGYEKPSTKLTFYKAFFLSQGKFLIHTVLQCMSAKRTSWNEFSSSMASVVVCLSSGRKFNFSMYIFDRLVRNVDGLTKFYMYPRFLQLMIRKQVGDLSTHTTKYTSLALTQKVLANMRRVGKGFSEVETPLFESMLVEQQVDEEGDTDKNVEEVNVGDAAEGDDSATHGEVPTVAKEPSIPFPTPPTLAPQPSQDIPSTSQLKRRVKKLERRNKVRVLKLRRLQRVGTAQRVETSDETVLDDVSNQERMIAEMDQDTDVFLDDDKEVDDEAKEVADAVKYVKESSQDQGRRTESQAEIYKIDLDHANKVLSMKEDKTEPAEVQEDKGKRIFVEEPKPLKKKQQIELDKQYARELQAKINKNIDWDEAIDHVKRKAKEDPAVKRYQVLKRKPQTEAQARKNMMVYLKNVDGFKMDYFKGMSYDDIRPIFEAKFNSNVAFLLKTKEQIKEDENRALKILNKTPAERAAKRQKLDKEVEELKRHLQIMPNEDDDVYTEATPLARKVPVVDYQIIELNNKPYYKIIRADDTHQFKGQRIEAIGIMWCADHNFYIHPADFVGREEVPTHKIHSRPDAECFKVKTADMKCCCWNKIEEMAKGGSRGGSSGGVKGGASKRCRGSNTIPFQGLRDESSSEGSRKGMPKDIVAGKQPMIEDEPLLVGADLPTPERKVEDNPKPTRSKKSKAVEDPNQMRIFHENRGKSKRIFNRKMKIFKFDKHGSRSTPDKAFDVE